ncbi:RNA polymerase sigma factor [Fimbriiglobus ruber]|uniref:RNA polymerase sigma-70 factor, ECF subfamily n=1 Tax=Fimbriiglobus ruber TaxID=1908690 RepID=A0A225DL57_9BACT|nr:sigma-70 family RNA polymerase sigma factor [Fimbriiglobus ruber]OWK38196.1 RNA polymerase sigma-70 factor, ECF subfamily [Fimbriiglobus ruber]
MKPDPRTTAGRTQEKPDPGSPSSLNPRRDEFDALYARHSREVWAVVYGRSMDRDLALDVTQEAFLRFWRHMENQDHPENGTVEEIQNPRAWLVRVARNLADDYAKSAFRRNGTQDPEYLNGVGAGEQQPLEQMARDEADAQIRAVVEELPPADREIISLRYTLDYDAPAIAEMLGINVTAVYMRLSRARQRLAEKLAVLGVDQVP